MRAAPHPLLRVLIVLASFFGPATAFGSDHAPGPDAHLSPDLDWNFESGHVRPIALSPDGRRLFAVNTPDARLEIFDLVAGRLVPIGAVPVGLEPVAVAARSRDEAWVVNRLSDSVSVVRLDSPAAALPGRSGMHVRGGARPSKVRGRVERTLYVGDDPQDIVFAGPSRRFAYVTAAHRGQNTPHPRGEYAEPGVGRADVWVFDADLPGGGPGHEPTAIVNLLGDAPRALAVSPDGLTVYAAVFLSGNGTKVTHVCEGGASAEPCVIAGGPLAPGGTPAPNANAEGAPAPPTHMIIRRDASTGLWLDELGRDWTAFVPFELPDYDVFEIDARTDAPAVVRAHPGVGTVLFNMAVNPRTGVLYVSNTEARNEVRFEGAGRLAAELKPEGVPASVRGHLHEARITSIDASGVRPHHLNAHIPYGPGATPQGVAARSLAAPTGLAVSPDGRFLFVAALGSDAIGVLRTGPLEQGRSWSRVGRPIRLRGRGPTGVVQDATRLYVMTRIDHGLEVVDLRCRCTVQRLELEDGELDVVTEGRPFLYDARLSSSNGEAACASCHVFGHFDGLAWDLGDPDGRVVANPNESIGQQPLDDFHPMKGPLLTQTLRGLAGHGPMHWRGDRTAGPGVDSPEAELAAFEAFAGAFESLLGRDEGPLPPAEMRRFAEFAVRIAAPPSPTARLDERPREDEARGRALFFDRKGTLSFDEQGRPAFIECNACHTLDMGRGLFGTSKKSSMSVQSKKVPTLRSLWERVGMFGMPRIDGFSDGALTGPQVRAYGFDASGFNDTIARFLSGPVFAFDAAERRDLEAFLMAFPSRLAPAVGQQVTIDAEATPEALERLSLLADQARMPRPIDRMPGASACDLVARGIVDGRQAGFAMDRSGAFVADRAGDAPASLAELISRAGEAESTLTFTCVPPGEGRRLGIDRDLDGVLDGDAPGAPTGRGRGPASAPPRLPRTGGGFSGPPSPASSSASR